MQIAPRRGATHDGAILCPDILDRAEAALRQRRAVEEAFGRDADLLHDPAWLILVDMLVQWAKGRIVTVGGAAIASGVPTTTALRWIGALVARGLVERIADPNDRRRTLLALTGKGLKRLERSFASLDRAGGAVDDGRGPA